MLELEIQIFSISVEVVFPEPRVFSKEQIDGIARWLTNAEKGFALRPDQVHLRAADVAFDYQLNAQLFGGNGFFALNAQKAVLGANNARGIADGNLLVEVVNRFLAMFVGPSRVTILLSANAHAKLESASVRDAYLKQFRLDQRITGPGVVGYVRLEGWPEDVRFQVEPSLGISDSLFLAWNTKFSADDLQGILDRLIKVLQSAVEVYGLKLKPLA